jgi:pimeloyl-ACP methyl ester carboxylesterase
VPRLYWTQAGRARVLDRYTMLLRKCQVPNEQRRVATCMGETFVLSCGPEAAPPLILLHGGNTNSLMWLRSLPDWARHFRVHAIDSIGDPGFSEPARPDLATDAHARWLDDVLRALGITRAAVVGASFGGGLALDYAIRRPENVERLALLAPAGIVRMDLGGQLKVAGLMLLGASGRRRALEISFGLDEASLDAGGREFFKFQGLVQADFKSRFRLPPVFTDAQLRAFDLPVMAVLGSRDIFFRADRMQRRLAACLPQAQVHLVDAGHGLGNPTSLVTQFLSTA